MKKIKVASTARGRARRKASIRKNVGIALIDLHSELFQVAACFEILHNRRSEKELRRGWLVGRVFDKLRSLREAIPPNSLLRDVSKYYKKFATEWDGYWIHGFLPVSDYLDAIEQGLDLALAGDRDYTRRLRELNSRFPYHPEAYRTGRYEKEAK